MQKTLILLFNKMLSKYTCVRTVKKDSRPFVMRGSCNRKARASRIG